jgi:hypothetical protein
MLPCPVDVRAAGWEAGIAFGPGSAGHFLWGILRDGAPLVSALRRALMPGERYCDDARCVLMTEGSPKWL